MDAGNGKSRDFGLSQDLASVLVANGSTLAVSSISASQHPKSSHL